MIIRAIIGFFCMILTIIPANSANIDKQKKSKLVLIENEIYLIAKENGLTKSDITVHWKQTISGNYNAIIKCNNAKKCNMSGVILSFPKANPHAVRYANPLPLRRKINEEIKPLFNTGNPGPKLTPSLTNKGIKNE